MYKLDNFDIKNQPVYVADRFDVDGRSHLVDTTNRFSSILGQVEDTKTEHFS